MPDDNIISLEDRMPGSQVKPFEFVSMGELDRNPSPPNWLIKGVIECGTHGMLFGDPESGKTLVLFDLLYCIALGKPWRNRRVEQGAVFYLCGEGAGGLARRSRAWKLENNIALDADIHFYTSRLPAALLDVDSARAVCESIKAMCEALNIIPLVVGIDTLARNFGGGDENSAKDVGQFIAHVDEYLIHELGCAVITSHHTGHGDKGRARGSMSLPGALDVFYQVEKDDDTKAVVMTCKKSKDFEKLDPVVMKLMVHDLGFEDEDGDEVTGATVRHDPDFKVTIKPSRSMPAPQAFCYEVLCELYEDARIRMNNMGQENEDVKLDLKEWRHQCTARRAGPACPAGSPKWDNARKYVHSASKKLMENGVVKHRPYGPFIYPSGAE